MTALRPAVSAICLLLAVLSAPEADSHQLRVTGAVDLGNATLNFGNATLSPNNFSFTLTDNDGTDPVIGTFAGLPEGATATYGNAIPYVVSYVGGTGNDVTLTTRLPDTYFLSEGATGSFFDDDILIANPHPVAAPVSLTFMTPGGTSLVQQRSLPAQSRTTIHVDDIPGLEAADVSAMVASTAALPLAVERTMFWGPTNDSGHSASSADRPTNRWYFAEGAQGFFHTYVQLTNLDTRPAPVTLTFLREGSTPIEKQVTVAPSTRATVDCGAIDGLANVSFGIIVDAFLSGITAERAMYFDTPAGPFAGGHATAASGLGLAAFFAEGATGDFFDTFLLLMNPARDDPAEVTLQFLLSTGENVTSVKTVPPLSRLTINVEQEDARLRNAAFATVVTADVGIVAERSMYWTGELGRWVESHNSAGITDPGLHWGLAEGRVGGALNFRTYILLANPQTTAAEVTLTFLRESGAPIVRTYTVPQTSRFNVDVNAEVSELPDQSFGVDVKVTNGIPIVVERSMYWDSAGASFKGGANAGASRLP